MGSSKGQKHYACTGTECKKKKGDQGPKSKNIVFIYHVNIMHNHSTYLALPRSIV